MNAVLASRVFNIIYISRHTRARGELDRALKLIIICFYCVCIYVGFVLAGFLLGGEIRLRYFAKIYAVRGAVHCKSRFRE